jgi:glycosyltransferase involved in cell wall biosynthesis
VGWAEEGDTILEEIHALAQAKHLTGRVCYHGYKSLGEELFAFYKNSDIYILASRSSFEGFPRTIWEAMAHSLPVVATRVGSIPDYANCAAELVAPRKPESLADGVINLLHNSSLRVSRIASGLELAHQNTLESQAQNMIAGIETWLRQKTV